MKQYTYYILIKDGEGKSGISYTETFNLNKAQSEGYVLQSKCEFNTPDELAQYYQQLERNANESLKSFIEQYPDSTLANHNYTFDETPFDVQLKAAKSAIYLFEKEQESQK